MMKFEFENITGLKVTEEEFQTIEIKYMDSKLEKADWCQQYLNSLKSKKAMFKSDIKGALKNSIELWQDQQKGIDEMSDEETYTIKYTDGSIISFNFESEEKPSLQHIENIHFQSGYVSMDFYNDSIMDEDMFLDLKETNSPYFKENNITNLLIVETMDTYFQEFDLAV